MNWLKFFRIFSLISLLLLLFISIISYRLSSADISNMAAAFGMNTVVLPNPYNTLNQELIKKENDLKAKEIALQEREAELNNATSTEDNKESIVIVLTSLTIILLIINLFLNRDI